MKTLSKILLIAIALSLSSKSLARKEFPFCPAGGLPGWMNYFDYKRDQNIRRHYPNYQSPYLHPVPYRAAYYGPYSYSPYYNGQAQKIVIPYVESH